MMEAPSRALLPHLWQVALPFHFQIMVVWAGLLISGLLHYHINLLVLEMMQITSLEEGGQSTLLWLTLYYLINCVWQYGLKWYRQTQLSRPIRHRAHDHFWRLMEDPDLDWYDETQLPIPKTIEDGATAVCSVVDQSTSVFRPLIQMTSQVAVIYHFAGSAGLITLLLIGLITVGGIRILLWSYRHRKKVQKKTNPWGEFARNLANTHLVRLLGGRGRETREQILELKMRSSGCWQAHNLENGRHFSMMEGLHVLLVAVGTWFLAGTLSVQGKVLTIGAIHTMLNQTCDKGWWLFFRLHDLLKSAAHWGSMEKLLQEYQPAPPREMNPLRVAKLIPEFEEHDVIQLMGPSGAGKTTFMKGIMKEAYQQGLPGEAWYIWQKPGLTTYEEERIWEVMTRYTQAPRSVVEPILLEWCRKLGLESVVKAETLDQPFKNPSGGEVNRLVALQVLLPLLMPEWPKYQIRPQLLCVDEVLANLDGDNRQAMIELLESLQIKLLIIDHHEAVFPGAVCLQVQKEERPPLALPQVPEPISWWESFLYLHRDPKEKKPKEQKRKPRVWIDRTAQSTGTSQTDSESDS